MASEMDNKVFQVHKKVVQDTLKHKSFYMKSVQVIWFNLLKRELRGNHRQHSSKDNNMRENYDKYAWALCYIKAKNYKSTLATSFGFIPLEHLKVPNTSKNETVSDPIKLHEMICDSEKPNFMSDQITLKSHLNPDKWDELLEYPASFISQIWLSA